MKNREWNREGKMQKCKNIKMQKYNNTKIERKKIENVKTSKFSRNISDILRRVKVTILNMRSQLILCGCKRL